MIWRNCKQCGDIFMTNHIENQIFCNRTCYLKWIKINAPSKKGIKMHPKVKTQCDWCGIGIEKYYSIYTKTDYHYCNKDCQYKHQADMRRKGKQLGKNVKHDETTRLYYSLSRKGRLGWRKGKTKYTDSRIMQHSENMKLSGQWQGEDNPNWRGGRDKQPHYGKEWKDIKKLSTSIFGKKCLVCDSDRKINYHHLLPYRIYGHDYNIIIPLCKSCHIRHEKHIYFLMRTIHQKFNDNLEVRTQVAELQLIVDNIDNLDTLFKSYYGNVEIPERSPRQSSRRDSSDVINVS